MAKPLSNNPILFSSETMKTLDEELRRRQEDRGELFSVQYNSSIVQEYKDLKSL